MFILYINDISENVSSHIRLFADDCIMYRTIESIEDSRKTWTGYLTGLRVGKCSLMFKLKCVALRCTCLHSPMISTYSISGHTLELKHQHPYLGLPVN